MVFWKCKKTINLLKMSRLDQGAEKWRLNGRRKDAQIFPDRWSSPSQSGSHQNIHFFNLRLLSWKSCTNLLRSVIIAAVLSRKIWRCSVWRSSWKTLQNFQLDIYPARHVMIVWLMWQTSAGKSDWNLQEGKLWFWPYFTFAFFQTFAEIETEKPGVCNLKFPTSHKTPYTQVTNRMLRNWKRKISNN